MSRFRKAWTSLNFDKEYLFGFETLVFAASGILSMHEQLVTPQRERTLEITSYDPFTKVGRCSLGSAISLSYLNCKRFEIISVYFYLFIVFVCFNSNIWQHCINDSAGLEHGLVYVMQMLGA